MTDMTMGRAQDILRRLLDDQRQTVGGDSPVCGGSCQVGQVVHPGCGNCAACDAEAFLRDAPPAAEVDTERCRLCGKRGHEVTAVSGARYASCPMVEPGEMVIFTGTRWRTNDRHD